MRGEIARRRQFAVLRGSISERYLAVFPELASRARKYEAEIAIPRITAIYLRAPFYSVLRIGLACAQILGDNSAPAAFRQAALWGANAECYSL